MRRKLIAGNWKMHGSRQFVERTLQAIRDATEALTTVDKVICPVALHLPLAEGILSGSNLELGAQNVHQESEGAFTGEVAAAMLVEYSVRYVIVGHSERRELFAETDGQIAQKFMAVQASGMTPILCVGESLEQREQGVTGDVVLGQLDAVVHAAGIKAFEQAIIAYEPVWAIGTGKTASPEQAQEVHSTIRQRLAELDSSVARSCRILYGGSVKAENAGELFAQADIDGGLVGGASLKANDFASICQSAS